MGHYTPKEVNLIKREIRTGKPAYLIADELSKQWGRSREGLYSKALALSKKTYKIRKWEGPTKIKAKIEKPVRPAIVQEVINFTPMPGSVLENLEVKQKEQDVIQEVCQDIMNLVTPSQLEDNFNNRIEEIVTDIEAQQQPAEIEVGIEIPVTDLAFVGVPSKVVVYKDHVRYYYSNQIS